MGRVVTGPGRPYTLARVPMFFALSGFLVAASAFRTRNVLRFLGLRALRILPALVTEVTLSAVLLGSLFTTLPIVDYFRSSGFYKYFFNIIGIVTLTLPGVFKDTSPSKAVNGNLWTLPIEFDCYFVLAVVMLIGVLYNRKLFTGIFVVSTLVMIAANTGFSYLSAEDVLSNRVVFYYFITGVLVYHWRHEIPYSFGIFIVAILVFVIMCYSHRTIFIYPLALTYVTIFIGLSRLPEVSLFKTGDYSYGVYLYGYPITQGVIAGMPFVRGNIILIIGVGLTFTMLFAMFSWHVIEKNALKLKRHISPNSAILTNQLHPETIVGGAAASVSTEVLGGPT